MSENETLILNIWNRRNDIKPLYATIDQWVRPTIAYDTYAARKAKEFLARNEFTAAEERTFISLFSLLIILLKV